MDKYAVGLIFALLFLTAGCGRDNADGWQELRQQANELYNQQQFDEALAIYEQAMSEADAGGRLMLRQDIVDCHLALGRPTEARMLLSDLIREAHDAGDGQAEAEAAYTLGEQLYKAGDGERGFAYMLNATQLMQQVLNEAEPDMRYGATMTLAYFHHGLMKWYCTDEAYPQAIAHSKAVEEAMLPLGDDVQARKYRRIALSTRAYIYMHSDSVAQAKAAYQQWQQLLPCLNLAEERDICPYYIESGHYQEALEIYGRYEQNILAVQGYWTTMERLICRNLAEIYVRMGMSDSAYSRLMKAYEIRDTLYARQAVVNAQELEAVYQNQQKSQQISRLRLCVIVLGSLLAALVIATLAIRMRRLREQKNRAMARMAQQIQSIGQFDDLPFDEQKRQSNHDVGRFDNLPLDNPQQSNRKMVQSSNGTMVQLSNSVEAARFAVFDRTVEQSRLYTQSDLSREVLADLMGVDRTLFSRIIQEQSGCKNLKDYLNQKRMRLAEEMLRQHPSYTIEAVAKDCGLGLTTFKRLCKEKYGMSASDYRNSLRP